MIRTTTPEFHRTDAKTCCVYRSKVENLVWEAEVLGAMYIRSYCGWNTLLTSLSSLFYIVCKDRMGFEIDVIGEVGR